MQFVQGDMYVADSKASVMALFPLPSTMLQLLDKFLALNPRSRIVANTYGIQDWTPDYTETISDCDQWCVVLLWIVPAPIKGTWQTAQGTIDQQFQKFSGVVRTTLATDGTINGAQVTFLLNGDRLTAVARGDRLEGTIDGGGKTTSWRATRTAK